MLVYGEIDFPEDETEIFCYDKLINNFYNIKKDIENILSNSKKVENLINGIKVAILGKVNAGKSSIFNMILGKDRAIVSSVAGTTRDFLSENIYIENIPFYLILPFSRTGKKEMIFRGITPRHADARWTRNAAGRDPAPS